MSELFININILPYPDSEFVAWVDVMGTRNIFKKTDKSPTLYILKLHKCAHLMLSGDTSCKIYPVIDGFYITHDDPEKLISIIKGIFIRIANEFIEEKNHGYKFMIRAGIAVGSVIHGDKLLDNQEIQIISSIKSSLLFGKAVVDAFEAESNSPPFSINLHKQSRSILSKFAKTTLNGEVVWFDQNFDRKGLRDNVIEYYSWRENNPHWVDYPTEKKEKHLSGFLKMIDNEIE